MTIEQAAKALHDRLQQAPWFRAVGIGEYQGSPCLYLYVNSLRHADLAFLRGGWHGFHVEVRRMGTPRATKEPLAG
jgi:hypothetical protein